MKRDENSCDQLRRAEKRRDEMEMRWWYEMSEKPLRRHDRRWDEMRWHRPWWQWDAMSNFQELHMDTMRWDEMRKGPEWQVTSQEIVAAKHRKAHFFFRSIGHKSFNFEISAPSLPGTTCHWFLRNWTSLVGEYGWILCCYLRLPPFNLMNYLDLKAPEPSMFLEGRVQRRSRELPFTTSAHPTDPPPHSTTGSPYPFTTPPNRFTTLPNPLFSRLPARTPARAVPLSLESR